MEPHRSVFDQTEHIYPPQNTPLTKQKRPPKGGRFCFALHNSGKYGKLLSKMKSAVDQARFYGVL